MKFYMTGQDDHFTVCSRHFIIMILFLSVGFNALYPSVFVLLVHTLKSIKEKNVLQGGF